MSQIENSNLLMKGLHARNNKSIKLRFLMGNNFDKQKTQTITAYFTAVDVNVYIKNEKGEGQ